VKNDQQEILKAREGWNFDIRNSLFDIRDFFFSS